MIMAEDSISVEDMEKDEPPDEKFQYLVPLTIKGYNLRRKQVRSKFSKSGPIFPRVAMLDMLGTRKTKHGQCKTQKFFGHSRKLHLISLKSDSIT